jgi:hypothetical protein
VKVREGKEEEKIHDTMIHPMKEMEIMKSVGVVKGIEATTHRVKGTNNS